MNERDYDFCPVCGGLIEASDDSSCACSEDDNYTDPRDTYWNNGGDDAQEC